MSDHLITSENARGTHLEMTETEDAYHTVAIDDEQPNVNHIVVTGNQQASTVQLDPLDDSVLVEDSIDDLEYLDRKISQAEGNYSKIIGSIYKFLSFYAIMQTAILDAVFSAQQSNCKDSWGLLALSAFVSCGVIVTLIREFLQQFHLLKRGRLHIEKRNSLLDRCLREGIRLKSMSRSYTSWMTLSDAKEDDLGNMGINSNHWKWSAERVLFVATLIAFSICLWLSCKYRLSCP